jgi:hypothetical protein
MDQVMPVGIIARQARELQAHHNPDLAPRDRRDQLPEPGARLRDRAAPPLIVVQGDHLGVAPAQGPRLLGEGVLPPSTLLVFAHLRGRRLSDIDIGRAFAMLGANRATVQVIDAHRRRPPGRTAEA